MPIRFQLNGRPVQIEGVAPTTTLLEWLRATGATGSKEGCAEGDCGACSVAVLDRGARGGPSWRAVDACLIPLPQMQGEDVVTVEGLADGAELHPAQRALVDALGSQCGYCTPGFAVALFEATYRQDLGSSARRDDQISGNLCRCTGYRPIREALDRVAGTCPRDRFHPEDRPLLHLGHGTDYGHGAQHLVQPSTWDGLWDAIDAHRGEHRFLHGATDLGLDITQRHVAFPALLSLRALPGLDEIREDGDHIAIGAGARLSDVEAWAASALPVLARILRFFASRQIKNRATVGGNLCNASPIGDLAPVLLALDAVAVLRSRGGERRLPLSGFFPSYRRTALVPGEILARVELSRPAPGTRLGAYKVSKRRELDISAVAAGIAVELDGDRVKSARLGFGGMAATPKRAAEAEAALLGRAWNREAIEAAAAALDGDFTPIDDHRASAWYRMRVAKNVLHGFFAETSQQPCADVPVRPTATVVVP